MTGAILAPAAPVAAAAGPVGLVLLGVAVAGLTAAAILAASKAANESFKDGESGCVAGCGERTDDVAIDDKIKSQLGDRGWTEQEVKDAVKGPPAGTSTDKRSPGKTADGLGRNDSATVYGGREGYVVVNDRTREVVQVSDRNPGSGWMPDSRITWNKGK